jgi:hypothetical protein
VREAVEGEQGEATPVTCSNASTGAEVRPRIPSCRGGQHRPPPQEVFTALDDTSEHTFPSTTFAWRKVRIRRPAGGQGDSATKSHRSAVPAPKRFWGLPYRNPRVPLAMTLKLRGGAEAWVEVHSRGRIARYPGHTALVDVLLEACQDDR